MVLSLLGEEEMDVLGEEAMDVCSALLDLSCTIITILPASNTQPLLQWGAKRRRNSTTTTHQYQGKEDDDTREEGNGGVPSSSIEHMEANRNCKTKRIRKKKTYKELKEVVAELVTEQQELKSGILEARKLYEQLTAQNLALQAKECLHWNERLHQQEESERHYQPRDNTEPTTLSQESVVDQLRDGQHGIDSHALQNSLSLISPGLTSLGVKNLISIPATIFCRSLRNPEMNISMENDKGVCIASMEIMSRAAIAAQARQRRIQLNRLKGIKARPRLLGHSLFF